VRQETLDRVLAEDGADWRDVTSGIVAGERATARILAREGGVVAGVAEATEVFDAFDVAVDPRVADGESVDPGETVAKLEGPADGLLRAERLALNFLMSMSGVASRTRTVVDRVAAGDGDARVAATRKTTPGYRSFEKRAVRLGGGDPHRYDLADAVLIKENHVAIAGLEPCVERARRRASFTAPVEVEVETVDQAARAAAAGADILLLDNMTPAAAAACVEAVDEDVTFEASGGITPETAPAYADAGVDVVSMGSIVYDAGWLDMSLLVDRDRGDGPPRRRQGDDE
jgi:nicotinate-nucleotide pyrophosphorylase (carboxylating)